MINAHSRPLAALALLLACSAAATAQTYTLESLRNQFAAGRKPAVEELHPGKKLRCFSILNKRDRGTVVDEVTFDRFNDKLVSLGSVPSGSLEYRENSGSFYSSFPAGKRRTMHFAPAYRVSGGMIVREASILHINLPLMNPEGFPYLEPVALTKEEMGAITRVNTEATVMSYGVCRPAD